MTLACHNLFDVIDKITVLKGDQVFGLHEMSDRHTLVDETCCGVSIVRSGHNGAAMLLCQLANGHGNGSTLTDDNAVCLHLNRAQLGFVTVSKDNQIMLGNIILHHIRVCSCNQNLTLIEIVVLIADYHCTFQCLQNVLILGMCLRQNAAV